MERIESCAKSGVDTVMSSVMSVSLAAAAVGAAVLLIMRPAFVIQRGSRRVDGESPIDPIRVGTWVAIVFVIVAFRDYHIQAYRYLRARAGA